MQLRMGSTNEENAQGSGAAPAQSDGPAAPHLEPLPVPQPRFVDWLLTVPYALTFLTLVLVFDLLQRIAILFGRKTHDALVLVLNHIIVFSLKLLLIDVKIEQQYKQKSGTPILIVSNHQSMFDIPLLQSIFGTHYPRYVAKKELVQRWIPSVTFNLVRGGSAIIDRKDSRQAIPEIKRVGKFINDEKLAMVIFPEGTRARDGHLKQFKPGGMSALLEVAPDADIVPVTIENSWKIVAHRCRPVPTGLTIYVRVGEAIPRGSEDASVIIDKAYSTIKAELDSLRQSES